MTERVRLAAGLARDVVRVGLLLREVDEARWSEGPARLVERMRLQGKQQPPRSPTSSRRLRRVIHILDRVVPGGPNCYRRALVHVALDPNAAREPFVFGLDLDKAGARGHAWTASEPTTPFDVEFRL